MEDDLKKNEMEDDLNFKAVLLRLFNNKNLKKNGFDTIEIYLVQVVCIRIKFEDHCLYFQFCSQPAIVLCRPADKFQQNCHNGNFQENLVLPPSHQNHFPKYLASF